MIREEKIKEAAYSRYCNDSSVTFGLQCNCFEEGAKWADKTMIDNACEWLKNNMSVVNANAVNYGNISFAASKIIGGKENFLEQFKKAMEEQL